MRLFGVEHTETTGQTEPDLDYAEAKRQARTFLGSSADVEKVKGGLAPFAARVGVWLGTRFILVGAGPTFRAALEDARTRQKVVAT